MATKAGRKSCPPGKRNLAGRSSNPIAATKAKPVKRERRHVRTAVTAYVQLHNKANSAARGDVLGVLGQAAQNAATPATLARRKTPVSNLVPRVLLSNALLLAAALITLREEKATKQRKITERTETTQTAVASVHFRLFRGFSSAQKIPFS